MKKVPKLRFKEFNEEWEEKKLKELILLQRGSSPRPIIKYLTTSEEGVNWIKIGDTNKESKYIISTKEKITKDGAKKSRKVENGELILSNSMSFGRPFILKIDGYIHDGWFVIRKYEKNFNKEFLYQLLGSTFIQNQYKKLAAGGVVENISSELVYSVILGKTCLKEQEKIANFLSSVDKKISLIEEKLNLFKEYKKGIMQKIFSQELRFKDSNGNNYPNWEEKKLGEICEISKLAGFEFTNYVVYQEKGKIIALRALNIKNNKLELNDIKYIDKSDFSKLERSKLYKDDLMFTYVGTVGEVALIPENNKYYLAPNVCRIRIISNLSAKYLLFIFNSHIIKNEIYKYLTVTSQPALSMDNIRKFLIKVPCLEEQKKIADFLSSIDNKIEKIENEVENLKEFKKGLLQQMFV